ncbi:N-glycosylase/DNA lyase [Thermotoga caldifontis]|uniref:N-glycosylase/DNA lyase n=1 Tax=Thermotoga caldifontis TaxID=1508419 RepID=UPI00069358EC|nr:N-glycosylase/DNA lyase [Thermotoga caldifontis]
MFYNESWRCVAIRLAQAVESIRQEAKPLVEERFKQFKELGENGSEEQLYSELCFCILTANWSASGGMKAQELIGDGFITMSEEELTEMLTKLHHRYPKARASYIVRNRWVLGRLRPLLSLDAMQAREWLVKNVVGIGYKEASHFLRNVGIEELAILDRHVLSLMLEYGLIDSLPSSLTKQRYLRLESLLKQEAEVFGETLGKFDLYLWYFVKRTVEK